LGSYTLMKSSIRLRSAAPFKTAASTADVAG
jgi:hypothetical protein